MTGRIGRVAELWRYPVKSLRGSTVAELMVTERGGLGDRAWALRDPTSGRIAGSGSRACSSSGAQEELPSDRRVPRTAAEHHGGCLGVYASVLAPGPVRVGDPVILS